MTNLCSSLIINSGMGDEALIAKLGELLVETPGLGYRALHVRLKEDSAFSEVGLKRVQRPTNHVFH